MKLSAFGEKLSAGAGILSLMDDLGTALAEGGKIMMGGGNPGHIPEIQTVMAERLRTLTDDEQLLRRLIGTYDPPRGEGEFLQALASLLRREYGWDLTEENICLTNGSQGAFFLLFNVLAGTTGNGGKRKILLPMAPEYIGYADLGLVDDFFVSVRPRIEMIGDHFFKYRVDFEGITITDEIGALCVSRPTNPTGNVLTDDEIARLARLAEENEIPFIIDNAYGVPFPGMIYTEATPVWNENLILCMSLSKFGLPAVRTGIVIAGKEMIRLLSGVNAVVNLAPGSFGAMLTTEIIRSGEIIRLSREVIKPFYQHKMQRALTCLQECFKGIAYKVHVPEGAMFLWLWFPGLPLSGRQLYERLKKRGVVVVSGDYFFPGLAPGWRHTDECLRITYSQEEEAVRRGIHIIAEELRAILA
ncbi:valine--pyruvate transaminase [uncultured Desulfobulbus sp.]|uniref:valine--pyruvate transaminase n=1 Tax=uncultured Desulfobulbus sp. TaxID=239745 RepID=UPI0029C983DF|nr:valine--pyruvate transaminase [uncultured Desulfobulbus sp.]